MAHAHPPPPPPTDSTHTHTHTDTINKWNKEVCVEVTCQHCHFIWGTWVCVDLSILRNLRTDPSWIPRCDYTHKIPTVCQALQWTRNTGRPREKSSSWCYDFILQWAGSNQTDRQTGRDRHRNREPGRKTETGRWGNFRPQDSLCSKKKK